jgi:hypothetical protein
MPILMEVIAMTTALAAPTVEDHATRTALLDVARKPVSAALGKPVLFKVRHLRSAGRWAFLLADMQERSGEPLSYAGTPRADAAAHGMVSRVYAALLRDQAKGWTVVAHAIGPTDVAWENWSEDYGAPESLFRP